MDIDRLVEILDETTVQLRKGEVVEEKDKGGVHVVDIYAMPHESGAGGGIEKVDVHFVVIGVDMAKAKEVKDEVVRILADWPSEAWGAPIPKLQVGPSYIHVGGVLGDQGRAFQLFALGKALGLWGIITPETLGITGDQADQMAGSGFIMIEGYSP
ncbi:MAG TPA: hypothetical protein VJ227_04200 [Patescibacteria group bacterium]|nr:hypothetical protein [Patescibacteria group bacterium]